MGFFVDVIVGYIAKSTRNAWRAGRSANWVLVEAIVTAAPIESTGYGGTSIEIPYSYRFHNELYTGLHEEPSTPWNSGYMERFPKGRTFMVRVKPDEPEISVMRDEDQADESGSRPERIDL